MNTAIDAVGRGIIGRMIIRGIVNEETELASNCLVYSSALEFALRKEVKEKVFKLFFS